MFKLTIIGTLCLAVFAQDRFLQGQRAPKEYKDTDKIPYNANLKCGACIRGGYVFCIPGAEDSDPSTWA